MKFKTNITTRSYERFCQDVTEQWLTKHLTDVSTRKIIDKPIIPRGLEMTHALGDDKILYMCAA